MLVVVSTVLGLYFLYIQVEGWHGQGSTRKPVKYILKFFFTVHRDVPHGHFDDRETWYSLAVTRPVRTEALLKSFGRVQH